MLIIGIHCGANRNIIFNQNIITQSACCSLTSVYPVGYNQISAILNDLLCVVLTRVIYHKHANANPIYLVRNLRKEFLQVFFFIIGRNNNHNRFDFSP